MHWKLIYLYITYKLCIFTANLNTNQKRMKTSFLEADVKSLCVHKVGNKQVYEGLKLSNTCLTVSDELKKILLKYFIGSFKSEELFSFFHDADLGLNEVYTYCSAIFDDPKRLFEESISLAKHLFSRSTHPNIKIGEFYVVYFTGCRVENELVDAIGLFKSEHKDVFLQVYPRGEGFEIKCEKGTNINKLDKGCVVFNTHRSTGYLAAVVDNTNKGAEAKYWTDAFLRVRTRKDSYSQTQQMLSICKSFVSQLPESNGKAEKANLMNRSVEALKDEVVDVQTFAETVFREPELVSHFKQYKETYQKRRDIEMDDSFTPSADAVKRVAMGSMTTIHLDKNFDINIHGGEQFLERGYDEAKGMYYYRLYFKEEK